MESLPSPVEMLSSHCSPAWELILATATSITLLPLPASMVQLNFPKSSVVGDGGRLGEPAWTDTLSAPEPHAISSTRPPHAPTIVGTEVSTVNLHVLLPSPRSMLTRAKGESGSKTLGGSVSAA